MARLRKAIGQALLGLSDELMANRVRRERLEDYQAQQDIMLSRQLQFLKEQDALREAAATRAALLNRAKELEQRQFDTLSALPKRAGDLSESLPALVEEARQVGVTDPAMGTGGASITFPDDPRLGEKYRGETITHYARPIDPATGQLREERTPIEELIRIRQQAEQRDIAARAQAERERVRKEDEAEMRKFRATPGVDEEGTAFIEGPGGLRKQTGLSPQQAASREASIARARAAAVPELAIGQTADGDSVFGLINTITGQGTPVEGIIPPKKEAGAGDPQNARITMARELLTAFRASSDEINTISGSGQVAKGIWKWAKAKAQAEETPVLFDNVRGALAATLLAAISGAQASDRERAAMASIFPGWTTREDAAEKQLAIIDEMLKKAEGGPLTSPENAVNYAMTALLTGQLPGEGANQVIDAEDFLSGGGR